ncbi:hypothetical protein [Sphaerisporangium aureirubrum]|uniref:Uncharacterized protein n=1 Tax=Sphaerisporangium aureirubrum TaxID=1544736 RepID=A0ABW1NEH0_9ACTN
MTFTNEESQSVFDLLGYVLGEPNLAGPIPSAVARDAAVLLGGKAYNKMSAGIPEDRIRGLWPGLERALGDPDVTRCRICGCTENAACEGSCSWVPDPLVKGDLCSACVDRAWELVGAMGGLIRPEHHPVLQALYNLYAAWRERLHADHPQAMDQVARATETVLGTLPGDLLASLQEGWEHAEAVATTDEPTEERGTQPPCWCSEHGQCPTHAAAVTP